MREQAALGDPQVLSQGAQRHAFQTNLARNFQRAVDDLVASLFSLQHVQIIARPVVFCKRSSPGTGGSREPPRSVATSSWSGTSRSGLSSFRMARNGRNSMSDLRAASRLAVEATRQVTDVVQAMHKTIAAGPTLLGQPLATPTALVIDPVYWGIRTVTGAVGAAIDIVLGQIETLLGERAIGP